MSRVEHIIAKPRISRGLVTLFAVACGMSVASLYYAQPVLGSVATSFDASTASVGLIVTFAQVGYAIGLAFLVPLGDIVARRWLVPSVLVVSASGLLASALAPSVDVLIAFAFVIGVGAVAAQLLVPMAASLSSDHDRGRVVGTVMSGLLLGILLARTVSGVIAEISSWRIVYGAAAAMILLLAIVLQRRLPEEVERPRISYGALLRSTVTYFRSEALLRRRSLLGALAFGAFSVFWTTMAFLLIHAPYRYDDLTIGLFGLVGAAGALCANFAGRWADRRWTKSISLVFAVLVAASFAPLWWGRHSVALLIVGIIVLDVGVQGLQVTNQSLIYRLAPQARSRINSAYMVCYFIGGAVGSIVGSVTYEHERWTGVCVLGAGIGVIATLLALADSLNTTPHPSPRVEGGSASH